MSEPHWKFSAQVNDPKNSYKTAISILAAAMLLYGCAGTKFSFDNARQIKPGMTSVEVQQLMGKPYMITTRGNQDILVYSYANGLGAAKSVSFVLQDNKVVGVPRIPDSFK